MSPAWHRATSVPSGAAGWAADSLDGIDVVTRCLDSVTIGTYDKPQRECSAFRRRAPMNPGQIAHSGARNDHTFGPKQGPLHLFVAAVPAQPPASGDDAVARHVG